MHTIVSSGGVGQYELNQLVRRIRGLSPGHNVDESIEHFLKTLVTFPKALPRNLGA
jgi:RNA-splicing ligase RtcB